MTAEQVIEATVLGVLGAVVVLVLQVAFILWADSGGLERAGARWRAANLRGHRTAVAPSCEHRDSVTDNLVTSCLDCGEQLTAVTVADWPSGCASLYAGPGLGRACSCGAAWNKVQGFVYCARCDMRGGAG